MSWYENFTAANGADCMAILEETTVPQAVKDMIFIAVEGLDGSVTVLTTGHIQAASPNGYSVTTCNLTVTPHGAMRKPKPPKVEAA